MLKLKINCAQGSAARELANKISDSLSKLTVFDVEAKVAITGRDTYKITWYYNDNTSAGAFAAAMRDMFAQEEAIENDTLEYDVEGNPVTECKNCEDFTEKSKRKPDVILNNWETSGKLKAFCAMYGMKMTKPIHYTAKREQLTGSNARDWERITGEKIISENFIHFMTGYFEQAVDAYQTSDTDWVIKCLDNLFRYNRVFSGNKKVYIDKDDSDRLSAVMGWDGISKKKNTIILGGIKIMKGSKWVSQPLKDPNETAQVVDDLIKKYYPDFVGKYNIEPKDGFVYITAQ